MAGNKPGRKMLRNDSTIIDLWSHGYNYADIANRLHLSKSVVWRVIDAYKKEHPDIHPIDDTMENEVQSIDVGKVRALRKAGWSISEIAHEFYVTDDVIQQIFEQEGIA